MPGNETLEFPVYASVIVDEGIDKPLDYLVPPHLVPVAIPGSRLLVPIQKRHVRATLIALKDKPTFPTVHPIADMLSETPPIPGELLELAHWIARYYCTPLRKVLKTLLPPSVRDNQSDKKQLFLKPVLSPKETSKLCSELRLSHPEQARVLDILLQTPTGILLSELLEKADVSRSPINTLIKKNVLRSDLISIDRTALADADYFPTQPKLLSEEQQIALTKIKHSLHARTFETHLLFGVTGSGKTEVYLQAIEYALSLQKNALLLVPEIALTAQTIERLRSRFAQKIAILHHRLSVGERHDAWHHICHGRAPIVVGARSALFSPLPEIGLIIVDEEHESSYKQTDSPPSYHARDVAIMRGKLNNATVVLGSATPTVESYTNALKGKYTLSTLTQRPASISLPSVKIVDMKIEYAKAKQATLFSGLLLEGIKARIQKGEQTLLFLNRRGFHTGQNCQLCSHTMKCPHCDLALTFHLGLNELACHLCDYRLHPPPRLCPSCGKEEGLKYRGAGTELVQKKLHALFPEVRTLRLDADTTRHKGSHEILFKQFRSGKADVLIGTQMIAKGLHFPAVTLVGVLNADTSLHIPDFRASEHLFQLITQVSGRAGRGDFPGEVIVQTALPDHPTLSQAAAQNYPLFYQEEIQVRELFAYPPFTHLVKMVFSGLSESHVLKQSQTARSALISLLPASFELLPVVPCGHPKVKDNYRFQFLIKAQKMGQLTHLLQQGQLPFPMDKNIRLFIDIDPLSTFF